MELKVGDLVKVRNTEHQTVIKEITKTGWIILETPHKVCCNYYYKSELEKISYNVEDRPNMGCQHTEWKVENNFYIEGQKKE